MDFYRARIGPNKEDRIWNNTSQIKCILDDLESKKDDIKHLQLSENSINTEVAIALSEKIKNIKNLEHADFSDIFVSRCKQDLPPSLNSLIVSIEDKNIRILNLSDNAFGPSGVSAFDFYLKKSTTLRELYIENCGLGPEGAESVALALGTNKNLILERLKIGRNRLESKGASAFGSYFSTISTLVEFVAFQNGIKEEGMANLLKGLKTNINLQILKINDNLITGSSVNALIELITSLEDLRVIDISDSKLSFSAIDIFKQLIKCSKLEEIHCNYNDIEEKEDQSAIAELLQSLPNKLNKLELKGNEIKKSVFKKIVKTEKIENVDCYSESEMDKDELDELMSGLKI
jgi:Ran GTPase-activating protein 1